MFNTLDMAVIPGKWEALTAHFRVQESMAATDTHRLRILMVIPQLGYGGAQGALLRVASYLTNYADVTIALMGPRSFDPHECSPAGALTDIPVVILDGEQISGGSVPAKAARWWRMWRRLRTLKREYDVTISFLSGANLLNSLAGRKGRTVVSERGSKVYDTGRSNYSRLIWTKILDPIAYRGAARIVAASSGLSDEISRANPSVIGKLLSIEGTIDAEGLIQRSDLPPDHDLIAVKDYPTVIYFGRLHHQKGLDALIRSFAIVSKELPASRLLLIGDGREEGRLRTLAQNLGLKVGCPDDVANCSVLMAGYRDTPSRHLRLGRVVALPSRYEGLPNALIEAVAAGVPILASDCPWGPRSVLASPGAPLSLPRPVLVPHQMPNGILMPVPDAPIAVDVWSKEILAALKQPVPRTSRVDRVSAISKFDIKVTGPQWMSLCHELAEFDA